MIPPEDREQLFAGGLSADDPNLSVLVKDRCHARNRPQLDDHRVANVAFQRFIPDGLHRIDTD